MEIDRLRLYAFHGVMEQERLVGNTFEVSVSVSYPYPSDEDISSGTRLVDYGELTEMVKEDMGLREPYLEQVVGRIKSNICRRWPFVVHGMVKVAKLTPPIPNSQMDRAAVSLLW